MYEHPYLAQRLSTFEIEQHVRELERRRMIAENPDRIIAHTGWLSRMLRSIRRRRDAATVQAATAQVATEAPVTEAAATSVPVAESPVAESPVAESPVAESPVAEVPVTESPATAGIVMQAASRSTVDAERCPAGADGVTAAA